MNPTLPPEAIIAAVDERTCDRSTTSLEAANRKVYLLLKEGIKVSVPPTAMDSTPHPGPLPGRGGEGARQKTQRVRVVDWEHPANNDSLPISQFSVTGALCTGRPDVAGFANPNRSRLVVPLVTQKKKRGWQKPTWLSCPVPPGTAAGERGRDG